ncbi:hypothetical protein AC629_04015 [Bradyrhizobium sp. NAS80.1]|uniref:HEPN domain-containing protein n=1 Tax=Bradyrhizobium sp. NAS80.1 TaxID=1680159 RepID=UPI0009610D1F|nr:HEPN domain-containing protein [Bradyrhizobium sp. NAS80.1]OKO90743.1 hypothetical protein AC629_04015 [Bradyrhizobium sp. NAS80.1]
MTPLRHELMLQEADTRLQAADKLRQAGDESDSAYLLRLLAFELLLKAALEKATGKSGTHHRYHDLFAQLPSTVQERLLSVASERIGPSALTSDPSGVLKDLGSNFIALRYPYEKYGHMTRSEYEQAGAAWVESGAEVASADYRYHPEELFGLTFALQQHLDAAHAPLGR